jgi:hypothetical protein
MGSALGVQRQNCNMVTGAVTAVDQLDRVAQGIVGLIGRLAAVHGWLAVVELVEHQIAGAKLDIVVRNDASTREHQEDWNRHSNMPATVTVLVARVAYCEGGVHPPRGGHHSEPTALVANPPSQMPAAYACSW